MIQPSKDAEPGPGSKVLVVDDDSAVLDSLRRTLKGEGYQITTASNAVEALSLLSTHSFATIITDQRMPMLSGLELLAQAKELQPEATRVLITAVLDLNVVLEAINKGEIYRFIVKPWLREELLVTVQNAVQRHELFLTNRNLQTTLQLSNSQLVLLSSQLETQLSVVSEQNQQLKALASALEDSLTHSVQLCLRTMETFYPELGIQARRVHELCKTVGGQLNLSSTERQTLEFSAWLHDIGLVGIPRQTISRLVGEPKSITETERSLIEQHPILGQELVALGPQLNEVGRVIRAHHERYDGSGYPDRISGEAIPWLARLLAVAIALSESHQDIESTCETLRLGGSTRFDPKAMHAFLQCLPQGTTPRQERKLSLTELRPGMVVASGIYTSNGLLLVPDGQKLTSTVIEKLSNHNRMAPLSGSVAVYC